MTLHFVLTDKQWYSGQRALDSAKLKRLQRFWKSENAWFLQLDIVYISY